MLLILHNKLLLEPLALHMVAVGLVLGGFRLLMAIQLVLLVQLVL
jgi:hypothetical protein